MIIGKVILTFTLPFIFGYEQKPAPEYFRTAEGCASVFNWYAARGHWDPENMVCTDTRTGEQVWNYQDWFDSDQDSPPDRTANHGPDIEPEG